PPEPLLEQAVSATAMTPATARAMIFLRMIVASQCQCVVAFPWRQPGSETEGTELLINLLNSLRRGRQALAYNDSETFLAPGGRRVTGGHRRRRRAGSGPPRCPHGERPPRDRGRGTAHPAGRRWK